MAARVFVADDGGPGATDKNGRKKGGLIPVSSSDSERNAAEDPANPSLCWNSTLSIHCVGAGRAGTFASVSAPGGSLC